MHFIAFCLLRSVPALFSPLRLSHIDHTSNTIALLHSLEYANRPPSDSAIDGSRTFDAQEFIVLGRQDNEVHCKRRGYGVGQVIANVVFKGPVAFLEKLRSVDPKLLDCQHFRIDARSLVDSTVLSIVGLPVVDAKARQIDRFARGRQTLFFYRLRESKLVDIRL